MINYKETDSNPDSQWGQIHSDRFKISTDQKRRLIVVDDFYEDPHAVREYALKQYYFDDEGYLGMRTRKQHFFAGVKERFEELLNMEIVSPEDWEDYNRHLDEEANNQLWEDWYDEREGYDELESDPFYD